MSQMTQSGIVLNFNRDVESDDKDRWGEALRSAGANYYKFQLEKGESGRLHFQSFVQWKTRKRLKSLLSVLVEHMDCKAEAIQIQGCSNGLVDYCGKEESRVDGPWEWGELRVRGKKRKSRDDELRDLWEESRKKRLKTYEEVKWRDWQREVLDVVNGPVHPRKIYWLWEPEGNVGKSFLCGYLMARGDTVRGGGDTKQVMDLWYNMGPIVKTVVMDIPRSQSAINYTQIEMLKDGQFVTQMYGGKTCIQEPVHFIVFANREPSELQLSSDRWCIKRIA